jgi:hypothetical protein
MGKVKGERIKAKGNCAVPFNHFRKGKKRNRGKIPFSSSQALLLSRRKCLNIPDVTQSAGVPSLIEFSTSSLNSGVSTCS